MTLTFRYKRSIDEDGRETRRPHIPVKLLGERGIATYALVDSGADVSAIGLPMARTLGLDLAKKESTNRGVGGVVRSVRTTMRVELVKGHERHLLNVPVAVLLEGFETFPVLLGREGLFSKFDVLFQDDERVKLKRSKGSC